MPQCRRSARIASASKRSEDSPAPTQLTSVVEINETSPSLYRSSSRTVDATRRANGIMSSPKLAPTTPTTSVPVKLPKSEMHPSKFHQNMGPPSSGLRQGFTDIDYTKTAAEALIQNTPSKTPVPSSDFTFRYVRSAADLDLGPEARRIMDSVRKDAVKIKAQLLEARAKEQAERESREVRKIAAAKGKSGRFSAAHMAEFKKMDSIEGHASSFRAVPGRFTPVKASPSAKPTTPFKPGIKRSQSKANLDEPDWARSKTATPRPMAQSVDKKDKKHDDAPQHTSKRLRQRFEDDVSTLRPVSRDGSSIPRPKSSGNDSLRSGIPRSQTLGSIMTPTKASLARSNSTKTATIALVRSPSQPDLHKVNSFSAKVQSSLLRSPSKTDAGFLARSGSKKSFGSLIWGTKNHISGSDSAPTRVETPGRFGRIKSILKRHPGGANLGSAIPQLAAPLPKTPSRSDLTEKMFPAVPLTTPGQKRDRHVDFTPDTKRAELAQDSPSPVKSSIPRYATLPKLPAPKFLAGSKPSSSKESTTGQVTYPDLSAYEVDEDKPEALPESVPGTFTFRSDHTIRLDDSPAKGFGSSAGQASLRQVRKSTAPSTSTEMPGSFPSASEVSLNKENKDPLVLGGIPHGMPNKKRHRTSAEDDDDDEGSKRGAKKVRRHGLSAEGYALPAPKLMSQASPTKGMMAGFSPQTPSPQKKKKKKTGLSLSRLNMLAQPKIRK
ncbi:hypothetical protein F5Y14DRAFT_413043 [Nemania sp. NC0429]|nr:hypothetical protein F5Y14DRAFT_413043 [Nemania sp. NC0429]